MFIQEYGGVEMLYVPSEQIWLPDVVLFNNWDGNYEVTLMTKATLKYTGEVKYCINAKSVIDLSNTVS